MLDRDLAELYQVPTGVLNQAVKRHRARFPSDFMFRLSKSEFENWVSQSVIPNPAIKMSARIVPYAFTEHGVAMLSSVLNSERAIQINIAIVRNFVRMREMLDRDGTFAAQLAELERRVGGHDEEIGEIFRTIRELLNPRTRRVPRIGFKPR